jgi:NADP-dependent 3-hydroxy acid dehydrogenase YdfG
MKNIAGKVALVTGASSGMGAAITRKLLASNVRVAALARRGDRLHELGAGFDKIETRLLPIVADINESGSRENVLKLIDDWTGSLDILVNNAGLSRGMVLEKADPADLRTMLETNVWSLVELTRLAIPKLKASGAGDIVNIGSIAARATTPGSAVYAASKAAVGAFSESVRRELANEAVRVSIIHPGYVATEFFDSITDPARRERTDKAMAEIGALKPEAIADLVHFIISQDQDINIGDVTIRPSKQPI